MNTFGKNDFKELLSTYEKENKVISSKKLIFKGIKNKDVYNITAPIILGGRELIAGRVENRKEWANSEIRIFEKDKDLWSLIDYPRFKLEDPFITKIDGELIFGGTNVNKDVKGYITYHLDFYRGKDFFNLKKFAEGPKNMKDIRLIQLKDKRIGIFTRPKEKNKKNGKIGFIILNSLDELNEKNIEKAELIDFNPDETAWIGSNEIHLLADGNLGVLGHIAYVSKNNNKNYYPIWFIFNPLNKKIEKFKILAKRDNLTSGESKIYPELENVIFPGGIIKKNNNHSILFAGVGDAESQEITIKTP